MEQLIFLFLGLAVAGIPLFFVWLGVPKLEKYRQAIFGTLIGGMALMIIINYVVMTTGGLIWAQNAPIEAQRGGTPMQLMLLMLAFIFLSIWLYLLYRQNPTRSFKRLGKLTPRLIIVAGVACMFFGPTTYAFVSIGFAVLVAGYIIMAKHSSYAGYAALTFLTVLAAWVVVRMVLLKLDIINFNPQVTLDFTIAGYAIEDAFLAVPFSYGSIAIFEEVKKWLRKTIAS